MRILLFPFFHFCIELHCEGGEKEKSFCRSLNLYFCILLLGEKLFEGKFVYCVFGLIWFDGNLWMKSFLLVLFVGKFSLLGNNNFDIFLGGFDRKNSIVNCRKVLGIIVRGKLCVKCWNGMGKDLECLLFLWWVEKCEMQGLNS